MRPAEAVVITRQASDGQAERVRVGRRVHLEDRVGGEVVILGGPAGLHRAAVAAAADGDAAGAGEEGGGVGSGEGGGGGVEGDGVLLRDHAAHDPLAQSLLVSDSLELLTSVKESLESEPELNSLLENQQIILLKAEDISDMIDFSNQYAPEHLLLADERIEQSLLTNFGSLFVGENSAVAYGDYCSGPNHTLPTMGTADRSSGLSVLSFLKVQSIQTVNDKGRQKLSAIGEKIAEAEQLVWHQRSMAVRSQ